MPKFLPSVHLSNTQAWYFVTSPHHANFFAQYFEIYVLSLKACIFASIPFLYLKYHFGCVFIICSLRSTKTNHEYTQDRTSQKQNIVFLPFPRVEASGDAEDVFHFSVGNRRGETEVAVHTGPDPRPLICMQVHRSGRGDGRAVWLQTYPSVELLSLSRQWRCLLSVSHCQVSLL